MRIEAAAGSNLRRLKSVAPSPCGGITSPVLGHTLGSDEYTYEGGGREVPAVRGMGGLFPSCRCGVSN